MLIIAIILFGMITGAAAQLLLGKPFGASTGAWRSAPGWWAPSSGAC